MLTNYKILIVDDEPDNLKLLADILEDSRMNYSILQANNAEIAIRIAIKKLPDIIITDWNMPDKTGIELIKELKKIDTVKDIPVIVATGFMLTDQNLQTALNAGAVDYIRKPISPIELLSRTNSALMLSISHKENIRLKNNELSENSLYLIKSNEFNIKLLNELKKLELKQSENKNLINDIISQIDIRIKSDIWERFETSFNAVHSNFYQNILTKFPNLTKTELKLSALLMLGMNSKDISSILNQTTDSIKVARYRLRKKLNLIAKENLQGFLSSF